jgi:predicted Zn-dependent protease
MIDKLIDILNNYPEINGWKLLEKKTESKEYFFIKDKLDMSRAKDVTHYLIDIYRDFEINNKEYRGSASFNIHPGMTDDEIKTSIEDASYAASFIKNEYYPLVKPDIIKDTGNEKGLNIDDFSNPLDDLINAIYKADKYKKGWINSAELFLYSNNVRIINSEGIDVFNKLNKGQLEFITNWKEDTEEIELYKNINFADIDLNKISNEVNKILLFARDRAVAIPTPPLKMGTVILSGEAVYEFFNYYYSQSNARYIYENLSTFKVNEAIQGDEVIGDYINLNLDPFMKHSTESIKFDEDGFPLKPVNIIENGILQRYWGDNRHSYYLNIEASGSIKNIKIDGGSRTINELKNEPYLEIHIFSDFQIDPLTGNFGGEIRLGHYYNGEDTVAITGGSISGNIKKVQKEMYLSKELQQINNFIGPESIKLLNVNISGSE